MPTSTQTLLCRYHYDPLDRLAATASLGQPDALRFYQKNRLATEIQGAVQRSIVQHADLLLAQQQRVDSTVETTLLATDQQRSVLRLLDNPNTQSLTYNPYGHLPAESGLTSLLGFNGEHRDPVTGHYLLGNGYRAFNPVLMRFNSPDSLSPFGEGGINGYAYCAGDPVNHVDPSGHSLFGIALHVVRFVSRLKSSVRARLIADVHDYKSAMRFVTFGESSVRRGSQLVVSTAPSSSSVASTSTARQISGPLWAYDYRKRTQAQHIVQKYVKLAKSKDVVPASGHHAGLRRAGLKNAKNKASGLKAYYLDVFGSADSDYKSANRSLRQIKELTVRYERDYSQTFNRSIRSS